MSKKILIESLQTKGLQIRPALNEKFVAELVEILKSGGRFRDEITVFRDEGGNCWVADGHHRLRAYADAGSRTADCDVRKGGFIDALKYALGANAEHGQRRDEVTIRNAIMTAYQQRQQLGLPDVPSARLIADMVKCSDHYAANQLRTVRSWADATARTGADGKTRKIPPPPPARRPIRPDLAEPPASRARPTGAPIRSGSAGGVALPPDGERAFREPAANKPCDDIGREIPEQLLPLWERANEVNSMLTAISRVRVALKEAQQISDMLFSEVSYSSVIAHLDQAYAGIQVAKPYAVCPFCQGRGCRACCKRGLLSKFRWDKTVPRDLKQHVAAVVEEKRIK
jgi:hypothetical protein